MRKWKFIAGTGVLLVAAALLAWHYTRPKNPAPPAPAPTQHSATDHGLIPPQFSDGSMFLTPIMSATGTVSNAPVAGLTVPHHLLARDLIAQGFRFASASKYDLVVLMCPDHFFLGKSDVSVSSEDFSTALGTLSADADGAAKLKELPFVSEQNFFYREHGLGAELPFIKHYFPDTKVLALTIKESTPKKEIEQLVDALKKVINQKTLIIQSTDFSHYLTPTEAEIRDQQTMSVLKQGQASAILQLDQPQNTDSTAAQYIQMRLQQEVFHSQLQILAHRNSQDYTTEKVTSSTSYIVEAWVQE